MPEPNDTAPGIDSSFPRRWHASILKRRPLISPARHFIYPVEVEEVERGALELMVQPPDSKEGTFLATFALGFADPAVPNGVWSCPNPDWLCAVAGGYAYLVNTAQPERWEQVEYRPVLEVTPLPEQQLLLFSGHHSLAAYGPNGKSWETLRLSWEGFKILNVSSDSLIGRGWDMMTDREFEFQVDLRTGTRVRLN